MASQWVAKRKLLYGTTTIIGLTLIVGVPLYFFLHKTPTCSDGVKDQNEKGIDCGGVCTLLCPSDISAPIVLWQRAFLVSADVYNVVAYIQNPNILTRVDKVGYVFKLYDKNNVVIGERSGQTFLPANKTFAIFEAGIHTGGSVPVRTSFAFTDTLNWAQNSATFVPQSVMLGSITLTNESTSPRLDATLKNTSLQNISTLEAVAIIYDSEDNAIGASRTIVQDFASGSIAPITFTWPTPFSSPAVRKEILLRIYPAGTAF